MSASSHDWRFSCLLHREKCCKMLFKSRTFGESANLGWEFTDTCTDKCYSLTPAQSLARDCSFKMLLGSQQQVLMWIWVHSTAHKAVPELGPTYPVLTSKYSCSKTSEYRLHHLLILFVFFKPNKMANLSRSLGQFGVIFLQSCQIKKNTIY